MRLTPHSESRLSRKSPTVWDMNASVENGKSGASLVPEPAALSKGRTYMGAVELARQRLSGAPLEALAVAAYRIPTDTPESDGTLEWSATTLVTAQVRAGGASGFGYTYASRAAAMVIADTLAP